MPKDEFVKVDLELVATDPVVGANEPLLQVADGSVGQGRPYASGGLYPYIRCGTHPRSPGE